MGKLLAMTKKDTEDVALGTVSQALRYVEKSYGKQALHEAKVSLIVVNGVSINLQKGMRTPVGDGDEIGFLPLCGGG